MRLSSSGATASGVPPRLAAPAPPVVRITCAPGSASQAETRARAAYASSGAAPRAPGPGGMEPGMHRRHAAGGAYPRLGYNPARSACGSERALP